MPRSDPAAHRDQIRRANKARYRAIKRLVIEYAERFDAIYAEEAAKEGVAPKPVVERLDPDAGTTKPKRKRKRPAPRPALPAEPPKPETSVDALSVIEGLVAEAGYGIEELPVPDPVSPLPPF